MISIRTLGGLRILSDDGTPLAGAAAQPRRMAVLALLARCGERGITREKMLNLLWPDADDERGPRALAQAFYALRKELGSEDAITGTKELRLNSALVSSDIGEFATALVRGDEERAAALYEGPFLDGFRLPGADEFNRWVETERGALARDHARLLESLARGALNEGRAQDAVLWWQRLAALDPLNSRIAVRLMEAMTAAGDRAGAIRHAHVYELLVQEELDLPPDREVTELAQRLREQAGAVVREARVAEPLAPAGVQEAAPELVPTPAPVEPQSLAPDLAGAASLQGERWVFGARRLSVAALLTLVVLLAVATTVATVRRLAPPRSAPTTADGTVVAIGRITSYGSDATAASLAGAVSDLLATSLARLPDLRLVSQARMLELMHSADTSAAALISAARQAGATEVIDGVLYARPDGLLRLDLRRVDLLSGAIRDVHTVEGRDLFVLVDSGTVQLGSTLERSVPRGSVADVTTRSIAAYRMYVEGVRAYHGGDGRAALRLFDSALAEDSLFALAAYYGALAASITGADSWLSRIDRAKRLAARAPDRERLIITADWAYRTSSPILSAAADTLAIRYPEDVEGHLYSGIARFLAGEFLEAVGPLERAARLDSIMMSGTGAHCGTCEAFPWLISAYQAADSGAAAERVARRWLRIQPGSWLPTGALLTVLQQAGRVPEADSILRSQLPPDAAYDLVFAHRLALLLRAGDYHELDKLLQEELQRGVPRQQAEAWWWMAYQLREQGRFAEALAAARQLRRFPDRGREVGAPQGSSVMEAVIALEAGHAAAAAALFDSIARLPSLAVAPSERARQTAWVLVHRAVAQAAAGDTAGLARTAESIQAVSQASAFARDRRLHHHVRGLLLARRGADEEAIREFEAAIYSLTLGYTRTNYELARLYLRNQRARDAVRVLQPALRGGLEGSNLYVSRTELHELLAAAWQAAEVPDSAAAHNAVVVRAWAAADPVLAERLARARAGGAPHPRDR